MKKGLIILAVMLCMTGCSKVTVTTSGDNVNSEVTQAVTDITEEGTTDTSITDIPEGFVFAINDVAIPMNVDAAPILEKLGESVEYFEAASCAFNGLDKIYTYNGYEINTYPNSDRDFVSSVYFLDDSVSTPEGICIGSTLEEVTAAYGDAYTEKSGEYTYTKGQSTLAFIIADDCVTSITYSAIVKGME